MIFFETRKKETQQIMSTGSCTDGDFPKIIQRYASNPEIEVIQLKIPKEETNEN